MDEGTAAIGRRVGAHAAGIAFAVTYLWATLCGAGGTSALERGAIAAGATLLLGSLISKPAVGVVLDAIARDEARRAAEKAKESDA